MSAHQPLQLTRSYIRNSDANPMPFNCSRCGTFDPATNAHLTHVCATNKPATNIAGFVSVGGVATNILEKLATNRSHSATNTATNAVPVATNRIAAQAVHEAGVEGKDSSERQAGGSESRTANRRSREAYNAYQREYMRRKREKAC